MSGLTDALDEALDICGGTGPETVSFFLARLLGAGLEGEEWAFEFRADAEREKAQRMLTARARSRSVVLVSHDGRMLTKSGRAGVRGRGSFYQQKLFEEMTWAELGEWARQQRVNRDGLDDNLAMAGKLWALRDRVPGSVGPGDAVASLGLTVAEWLAS